MQFSSSFHCTARQEHSLQRTIQHRKALLFHASLLTSLRVSTPQAFWRRQPQPSAEDTIRSLNAISWTRVSPDVRTEYHVVRVVVNNSTRSSKGLPPPTQISLPTAVGCNSSTRILDTVRFDSSKSGQYDAETPILPGTRARPARE